MTPPVTWAFVANYYSWYKSKLFVHLRDSGAIFSLLAYTGLQLPRLSVIRSVSLLFPSTSALDISNSIYPLFYTSDPFCKHLFAFLSP